MYTLSLKHSSSTFSGGKSPCFCADVHWLWRNGMYIAVIGSLKGLQERKRATAFSIRYPSSNFCLSWTILAIQIIYWFSFRPITDFNEVTLHFIQCVRMHIENIELKVTPFSVLRSLKYSHAIFVLQGFFLVYLIGWQSCTNQFFYGSVILKWIQWIKHTDIFEIQSSKL
jgi:hypothetical protein